MVWPPRGGPHPLLLDRPAFVVADVARTMRSCVERRLRETGLRWNDFALLLVARHVDGLSQQALAERAGLNRTLASAALVDLEWEGYVDRRTSRADRRHTIVQITDAGREILTEAWQAVERGEAEALRRLTGEERVTLHALLRQLVPKAR
jgi:MarR family transcriptional regulator, transcriptional regulator for hemolysin